MIDISNTPTVIRIVPCLVFCIVNIYYFDRNRNCLHYIYCSFCFFRNVTPNLYWEVMNASKHTRIELQYNILQFYASFREEKVLNKS